MSTSSDEEPTKPLQYYRTAKALQLEDELHKDIITSDEYEGMIISATVKLTPKADGSNTASRLRYLPILMCRDEGSPDELREAIANLSKPDADLSSTIELILHEGTQPYAACRRQRRDILADGWEETSDLFETFKVKFVQ